MGKNMEKVQIKKGDIFVDKNWKQATVVDVSDIGTMKYDLMVKYECESKVFEINAFDFLADFNLKLNHEKR